MTEETETFTAGLNVTITHYVDDAQPGWVRATFTDVFGVHWSFIDKVPILTDEYLDEQSNYPWNGIIACVIVEERDNDIVKIDTSRPIDIEAETGEHEFYVFKHQLTDFNKWTSSPIMRL